MTRHHAVVRITHWVNALALTIMVGSGLRIFNAYPAFARRGETFCCNPWEGTLIPAKLTFGGWLGGAIQWHFAAMWLFVANGLVYVAYGIISGHFRRKLLPITPRAVLHDVLEALRGRLAHEDLSVYNAAQRAAYVSLIVALIVLVLSGLAIWKPVQFYWLALPMGDFDNARIVHFIAMAAVVLIVIVHVVMVMLVPRTLPTMITGKARRAS